MRHTRRVIGGVFILTCATLAAQSQQTRSSASGVYTADQAAAGGKIYFARCAACHGDDLGGRERAPALTGAAFSEAWRLHGRLRRTCSSQSCRRLDHHLPPYDARLRKIGNPRLLP